MSDKNSFTLFIDIGGVLLTNGWGKHSRVEAIKKFDLDQEEVESRHSLTFDMFEQGKVSLDAYLNLVVFYKPQKVTKEEFKKFMFSQSKLLPDMFEYIKEVKKKFNLRVVSITNEGKELMLYRLNTFNLNEVIDFFVCSSFVGMRKPDPNIFRLAIDLAQSNPKYSIYLDDRMGLIDAAEFIGWNCIHHTSYESTKEKLEEILNLFTYR